MAKQQSFADKVAKKSSDPGFKVVRLVYSYIAPETGQWRFADKLVKIDHDDNEQQILDNEIKLGRVRLEQN